jgi:hypothetical protein
MIVLFVREDNYSTLVSLTTFSTLTARHWHIFSQDLVEFSVQSVLFAPKKKPEAFVKICSAVKAVFIYFLFLYSFILWRLIFDSHRLVPPFIPWDDWNSISGLLCSTIKAVAFRQNSTILILEGFVLFLRKTYKKRKEQTPSDLFSNSSLKQTA